MRAVLVHLDAGLRFGFGVGVAADVRAPVDDEHPLAELRRHALGDRQAEESGADDEEVETSRCAGAATRGAERHRQQGYPTTASTRIAAPSRPSGPRRRSQLAHDSASSL